MRQAGFFFFFFFHQKTDEATFFFLATGKTCVKKTDIFLILLKKNRLWVCTRAASPIICLKAKIQKYMYSTVQHSFTCGLYFLL